MSLEKKVVYVLLAITTTNLVVDADIRYEPARFIEPCNHLEAMERDCVLMHCTVRKDVKKLADNERVNHRCKLSQYA